MIPVRDFGPAPRGLKDERYYAIVRAKFWAFALVEYSRVQFIDAGALSFEHLVLATH